MKSINPAAALPLIFMMITACTIVPPRISLTGEKTVIERQIIGDYRELESDAWVISSVKTPPSEKSGQALTGTDPELMTAIRIRQFHSEKIARYKAQGAIGEAGTGLAAYRPVSSYESKKDEKDVLLTVIKNENDARLTIFRRSLYLRERREPTMEEVSQFGRAVFAGEQRNAAAKGEWIQDAGDKWVQK
jgi:hypothetical protein